jgi:hypothetical protein
MSKFRSRMLQRIWGALIKKIGILGYIEAEKKSYGLHNDN